MSVARNIFENSFSPAVMCTYILYGRVLPGKICANLRETIPKFIPWVQEPKSNKTQNKKKRGEKVGSGQMVTSIVGIDQ